MAQWVKFSEDYDHAPKAPSGRKIAAGPDASHLTSYKANGPKNGVYHVPDDHADAAIAAGKAVAIEAPGNRQEADALRAGEVDPKVVEPKGEEKAAGKAAAK